MGEPAEISDADYAELEELAKLVIDSVRNDGPNPLEVIRAYVRDHNAKAGPDGKPVPLDYLEVSQLADGFILQMAQIVEQVGIKCRVCGTFGPCMHK